jgi:hypothetical protein
MQLNRSHQLPKVSGVVRDEDKLFPNCQVAQLMIPEPCPSSPGHVIRFVTCLMRYVCEARVKTLVD